jgi:hypothetical protein
MCGHVTKAWRLFNSYLPSIKFKAMAETQPVAPVSVRQHLTPDAPGRALAERIMEFSYSRHQLKEHHRALGPPQNGKPIRYVNSASEIFPEDDLLYSKIRLDGARMPTVGSPT